MAGGVPHLEFEPTNRHRLAVSQHQIGLWWRLHLEAKHLCLHRRVPIDIDLIWIEPNRQLSSEQTEDFCCATHVVEMTVGMENHRWAETGGAHAVSNLLRFFPGINNHELARFGITQQYTVRLDRTHRKNVQEERGRH